MDTNIPQKKLDELLGYVVNETPEDVRQLLKQNGYKNTDGLQGNQLSISFLKALKDDDVFRNEVADYLTGMVQHETSQGRMNFVSDRGLKGNFNAVNPDPGSTSTPGATTPSSAGGGSFWSSLGSSQNINSVLTSGLNVLSASLINKSNKASEERALQAKALDLQIAQTNAAAKGQEATTKKGMPAWGWVAIVLGVLAVGTIITVAVVKNRKKAKSA